MARGRYTVPIASGPIQQFELPAIEPLNSTAGEQWEFDGISENGTESFMLGFYRDPNFAFLGTGNLRFHWEYSFANGSRHSFVDYSEESVVEFCPDSGTQGTWTRKGRTYTFEISPDMTETRVKLDSPDVKGTVIMSAIAPPRYANNFIWPSAEGTTEAVPHFHWVEPMPVANVSFDGIVGGSKVSLVGMGGHERLWSAFSWYTCVSGMTAVRLRAGPYALSLVQFGSRHKPGTVVPSVLLLENGKKIFGSENEYHSETEDYVEAGKLYGGRGVTSDIVSDKVTGFELLLHSPNRQKTWKFVMTNRNIMFDFAFGEGVGSSGYSGTAEGGLVGSKVWTGPAFSEIMVFPKRSLILRNNFVE